MRLDILLRVAAKILIPFMLMFGAYVQWHGDYGPGGGFQAGAIIAAAIVLYAIVFGITAAKRIAPPKLMEMLIPVGVLIYTSVGVYNLLQGLNFLDYSEIVEDHHLAQEWGVWAVEIGVITAVTSTLTTFFYLFASRGRRDAPTAPPKTGGGS